MTVGPASSTSPTAATASATAETANATARLADSWECGSTSAAWTPAEPAQTHAPKIRAREPAPGATACAGVAELEVMERVMPTLVSRRDRFLPGGVDEVRPPVLSDTNKT